MQGACGLVKIKLDRWRFPLLNEFQNFLLQKSLFLSSSSCLHSLVCYRNHVISFRKLGFVIFAFCNPLFVFRCVSVPPDSLAIINEKGDHIPNYILGPYPEGSSINITCIATGGKCFESYANCLANSILQLLG